MQLTKAICLLILAATSATALASPKCGARGQACWKIRSVGDALTSALSEPIAEDSDPAGNVVGGEHYKAKMLVRDLAQVVAATQDDPEAFLKDLELEDEDASAEVARDILERAPKCGARGQACWKAKRDAAAEPAARCGARGQACWRAKRAAEAVAEAAAEANPTPGCGARGQACWKDKRDIHALQNAARDVLEQL